MKRFARSRSQITKEMTSCEPTTKKPKYVEDIQKLLECPVCFQNPKCPDKVHFCSNGHMICDECHAKIQRCPVCRSENLNGQNPILKQVLSKLPRVCPFSDQGCDEETDGNKMATHVKVCQFRLIDCLTDNCDLQVKKVPFYSFIDHHLEEHELLESPSDGSFVHPIQIPVPKSTNAYWPPTICRFDGHTFFTKANLTKGIFWIQFLLHGTEAEAEKYMCRIQLKNCVMNKNYNLDFSGDIVSINLSSDKRRDYPGLFSFSYSMAQRFFEQVNEDEKRLSFNVCINRIEAPTDPDEITVLEPDTTIFLD